MKVQNDHEKEIFYKFIWRDNFDGIVKFKVNLRIIRIIWNETRKFKWMTKKIKLNVNTLFKLNKIPIFFIFPKQINIYQI